jgi:glycosyltransferase involved in cell wall biosynthesis
VLDAIPRGAELVISHQWRTRGTAALRMRRARRRIGALVGIDYGGGSVAGYRLARLPLPIADVGAHISEFEETLSPVRAHRDVVVRGGTAPAVFAPPAVEAREVDFLMVGRFLPHKGQRDFLEALPAGASALLIGPSDTDDRPYLEDVQRLAAARDVEIRFDASDDELVDAYRRARFTAQVPRFLVHRKGAAPPELLGLTMLEAMACGSVPVAPGSGPTAEFVRAGETGVPYDPYADGALAAALREAVSSDERRLALQRGALEESRRWTWPAAARALLDTLP